MPPPAVLKEIADRGNAFSFYLTYMGVTADIGMMFLKALDMEVNEHYVSFLGIREDEVEEIFDNPSGGKKYPIGMKSKIRMAFKVIRAFAGVDPPPMPTITKVVHQNAPGDNTTAAVSSSPKGRSEYGRLVSGCATDPRHKGEGP